MLQTTRVLGHIKLPISVLIGIVNGLLAAATIEIGGLELLVTVALVYILAEALLFGIKGVCIQKYTPYNLEDYEYTEILPILYEKVQDASVFRFFKYSSVAIFVFAIAVLFVSAGFYVTGTVVISVFPQYVLPEFVVVFGVVFFLLRQVEGGRKLYKQILEETETDKMKQAMYEETEETDSE